MKGQQALVILNIQSMSLGPQTMNGKQKKADPVCSERYQVQIFAHENLLQHWASIKTVRSKISSILHEVSKELLAFGEACEADDRKNAFSASCQSVVEKDEEVRRPQKFDSRSDLTFICLENYSLSPPSPPIQQVCSRLKSPSSWPWAVELVRSRMANAPPSPLWHNNFHFLVPETYHHVLLSFSKASHYNHNRCTALSD